MGIGPGLSMVLQGKLTAYMLSLSRVEPPTPQIGNKNINLPQAATLHQLYFHECLNLRQGKQTFSEEDKEIQKRLKF